MADQGGFREGKAPSPIAFVSHWSACEILRRMGADGRRWPEPARMLPVWGDCVFRQREMAALEREVGLGKLGIATRPVDVLVPASDYRTHGKRARVHVWSRPIPEGSMVRVHPRVVVSGPEFAVFQLSRLHNVHWPAYEKELERYYEEYEALERYGLQGEVKFEKPEAWQATHSLVEVIRLAMEFMGTYRLGALGAEATFNQPPLMTQESALEFVRGMREPRPVKNMKLVLNLALSASASPRETDLAIMLALPVWLGGYGLPRPQLNRPKDAPQYWRELTGERCVRPDFLWDDRKLVVEYYGHASHRSLGAQKTDADIMRANMLRAMGFRVVEVTAGVISTAERLDCFALQIAEILGVELREANESELSLRRHLYALMFGSGE